jgi:dihydrodipicolinate synthase/N-acetylneuraminate lyase
VVLPTPFNEIGSLHEDGLRACVNFCIKSGSHGVVTPVNASEAPYLSDAERRQVVEVVIEEVKGRVPVVIGVTASCSQIAVDLARHAEINGADAVIAMPPCVQRASESEIRAYYQAINDAVGLPVFVQNYSGPGGTSMSASFMAELLQNLEHVQFVKEETEFSSRLITEVIEAAGKNLKGVMGGKAGRHLIDEFQRGCCGTMPACEVADIHVQIWNSLDSGDFDKARDVYRQVLPLLLFETSHGVAVYKEVLRRRGVIPHACYRQTGGRQLDAHGQEVLSSILEDIRPLIRHDYPSMEQ